MSDKKKETSEKKEEKVKITIRSKLSDSSFTVAISLNTLVEDVIERSARQFGHGLLTQNLENVTLALRHLETNSRLMEGNTLASYHIQEGDTLELYEESKAGV